MSRSGDPTVGHAARVATALVALALPACPRAPVLGQPPRSLPPSDTSACADLEGSECRRARGLLSAAVAFGNVRHEYLLDPASSMAPGRGVQRGEGGSYTVLPTQCARERERERAAAAPREQGDPSTSASSLRATRETSPRVDASTIDFAHVGVSIDDALVAADADLTPWLSAGGEAVEHKVSLVAVAFVRDLDPQFFTASEDVAFGGDACACGRATHFIGSVKMGGLISYEMRVRAGELRGRALDFVRTRLAARDTRVTQTVVGGLEIDALAGAGIPTSSSDNKNAPLGFHVTTPVPIAYALYPLADVCRFSFPAPDVSPATLDFGEVPYDREETRLLHVVNRAPIDLRATLGERTFAVPALGSIDLPLTWRPSGQSAGCQSETREDTIQFRPRDETAPVTPKTHSVRVVSRVRTGKASWSRHEHIDSGSGRRPDYASTRREWSCPPDYVVTSCRTDRAQCGDGACNSDGYAVNAEPGPNGCRFGCKGPEGLFPAISSHYCRFDARMECRLRCGP